MVKHTQTICQQFADKLFVFDHFVKLALKGLNMDIEILTEKTGVNNLMVELGKM